MEKTLLVKKYEDHADQRISIAILAPYVILMIQYFLLANMNILGTSGALRIQSFSKLFVGVSFVFALPIVYRRNFIKFVTIYLVGFIVFGLHYFIFPENQMCMKELIVPIFFMSFPMLVLSMSIVKLELFYEFMIKASFIIFVFGVILGMQILVGSVSIGTYSGPLSNYMLIPTIVFLNQFFIKYNVKSLIISIISIAVIVLLGSRGAILGIVVFILIKSLLKQSIKNYKSLMIRVSVLLIFLFATINFNKIIEYVFNMLNSRGIYSRTVVLLMQDDIHLSGREYIYKTIIEWISQHPIVGFGIAGDRRILAGNAVYSHNFILEIIGNYGVPIGIFILFTLISLIVKSITMKAYFKSELVLIWCCLGFIHLMVSSSYLIEMKFWILMGLLINGIGIRETNITMKPYRRPNNFVK